MDESTPENSLSKRSVYATTRQAARYCLAATLIFFAGAAWGYAYPEGVLQQLESLRGFAESLEGQPAWALALLLFAKNSVAAIIALLFGPALGIFPVYAAVMNGGIVGAMLREFPGAGWMLLPHGVFELPAMFLAWGLGMWIGAGLFTSGPERSLGVRFRAVWPVFLKVILPLLLVAAVIEASLITFMPKA